MTGIPDEVVLRATYEACHSYMSCQCAVMNGMDQTKPVRPMCEQKRDAVKVALISSGWLQMREALQNLVNESGPTPFGYVSSETWDAARAVLKSGETP